MKMLYAIAITLSMGGFCSAGLITLAKSDMPAPVVRATFNADGTVVLPTGYRRWTHVGTRLKAQGINILDGKPTKGPEIFNAYVEPGAMDVFAHTGQWPDGTQIVKEFSSVRTGEGCDATTGYCTGPLGVGIFEAGYVGLGMMVKDAERFPNFRRSLGLLQLRPSAATLCTYCGGKSEGEMRSLSHRAGIGYRLRHFAGPHRPERSRPVTSAG